MWSPTGIARRHAWRAAITRNRFIQAFTITPRKKVYYRLRQKRTKYNLEKTNLYNRLYPEAQTAFSLFVGAKIKKKQTYHRETKNRQTYRHRHRTQELRGGHRPQELRGADYASFYSFAAKRLLLLNHNISSKSRAIVTYTKDTYNHSNNITFFYLFQKRHLQHR